MSDFAPPADVAVKLDPHKSGANIETKQRPNPDRWRRGSDASRRTANGTAGCSYSIAFPWDVAAAGLLATKAGAERSSLVPVTYGKCASGPTVMKLVQFVELKRPIQRRS